MRKLGALLVFPVLALALATAGCDTGSIAQPGVPEDGTVQLVDRHGAARALVVRDVKEISDRVQHYETSLDGRPLHVVVEQPLDPLAADVWHTHLGQDTDDEVVEAHVDDSPVRRHDLIVSISSGSELLLRATIDRNMKLVLENPRVTRALGVMDSVMMTDELAREFDEDALLLVDARALTGIFLVREQVAAVTQAHAARSGLHILAQQAAALPEWRANVASLDLATRTTIYNGIVDANKTETISVKVINKVVQYWEVTKGYTMVPVSPVRAHYAIHHHNTKSPGSFLTRHRDYLANMEGFLAKRNIALPYGRIPMWDPAMPIPAPFDVMPVPPVACPSGTQGRTDTNCDWYYVKFTTTNPLISMPTNYGYPSICSYASLDAVVRNEEDWHDTVHSKIGGTMGMFDSPSAPVFWIWHGWNDNIYNNWLACGK